MKKVLFVIATLSDGGAERALSNIVTNFPCDWEIEILLNNEEEIIYPYRGNIISLDLKIPKERTNLLYNIKALFARISVLRKIKRDNNYAACISFMDSANFANILSGHKYCKTICSVRLHIADKNISWKYKYIVNPVVKLLYRYADKIVAVSEEIRQSLVKDFSLYPNKIDTIVNGYSIRDIMRRSEEEISDDFRNRIAGKRVIMTAGRLTEQKGQWHLIRTFAELIKTRKDVVLVIAGDGNLKEELQLLLQESDIEDCVIMTGFVNNIYKYLKHADIFVLPSLYEGFPNALAEAICMGIPSIATDFHSGAREIIAPEMLGQEMPIATVVEAEYGLLTPVCSGKMYKAKEDLEQAEIKLAEAMARLLEDENLYQKYKRKSRELADKLDIQNIVKQWIQVIEQ